MASESASREARTFGVVSVLEDGALAGLIGACVVAVWFLLLDTVRGEPFLTPTLLGSVVLLGTPVEEVTVADPIMVFAYTGMHGLLFLIAGMALAWVFVQFERNPQFGVVLLLVFLLFESIVFGLEVSVVPQLVGALRTWAVFIANLTSAVAMFWLLLRRRPEALARLRDAWNE